MQKKVENLQYSVIITNLTPTHKMSFGILEDLFQLVFGEINEIEGSRVDIWTIYLFILSRFVYIRLHLEFAPTFFLVFF
jgi:hypothetical protein